MVNSIVFIALLSLSRPRLRNLQRRLQANWVWIRDILIDFTERSSLVTLDQVPSISSSRIKVSRQVVPSSIGTTPLKQSVNKKGK